MFNVRYNVLAVYQVVLGLGSSLLLMRAFGVSGQADAYLIATNIMNSLQFIQLMCVEQFMFFYHDLKVEDREDARRFYNAAVTFGLLSGAGYYGLFLMTMRPIAGLFAFALDAERYGMLMEILPVMCLAVLFDSANTINQRLFNAEMRFSIPYILGSLQTVCTILVLAYIVVSGSQDIRLIAWARPVGTAVTCLSAFIMLRRLGFPFQPSVRHPSLLPFIRNSFTMRCGYNIHNFLINPITNNVLSMMPSGTASCFYYAQRLHQMIGNVVVNPSYSVLHARISQYWSERDISAIRDSIRRFLPVAGCAFVAVTLLSFVAIPYALELIASQTISPGDVGFIQKIFLAMAPWYLVALLESPFLSVNIASKRSTVFLVSNSMFIATYFLLSLVLVERFGIYTIPVAMTAAQLINLMAFVWVALLLLRRGWLKGLPDGGH